MAAALDVKPSAGLSSEQEEALAVAAQTLPDGWAVIVAGDPNSCVGFTVRIVGVSFATVSAFAPFTRPERLAAFAERVRREHG